MATQRWIVFTAGLFGAAGVALSAMAAHAGGPNLQTAANFLLLHAPALLALGMTAKGRWLTVAAWVLAAGCLLFCGDLVLRELAGQRLFAMAAPAGGMLMIAGWLAVAAIALAGRDRG